MTERNEDTAWQEDYQPSQAGNDPEDAFAVPFNVIDGVALVVWTIVAQILIFAPLLAAGFELGNGVPSLLVLIATQLVIGGGIVAWLAARGSLSWRVLGPIRPRPGRHVPVGLGVGALGFMLVTVTVMVADQLFGPFEAPSQQLLETTTSGGLLATLLGVVIAVVLAPIVEETIFRGVLFQALHRRLGYWWAVALSGAMFSAVHVEITQWALRLALFLLGAWFAIALRRWGSLLVPIMGHAVFNGVAIALSLTVTQ
ncbi:MAG: type II CAAX endopeptidase family protein [Nitriliruptorales bacterium]|nr:type II CAAX endopeptidase family protein [Nitriliruptorales bacterium]